MARVRTHSLPKQAAWLRGRMQALAAALGPGSEARAAEAAYNGGLELLAQDAAGFKAQITKLREVLTGGLLKHES